MPVVWAWRASTDDAREKKITLGGKEWVGTRGGEGSTSRQAQRGEAEDEVVLAREKGTWRWAKKETALLMERKTGGSRGTEDDPAVRKEGIGRIRRA